MKLNLTRLFLSLVSLCMAISSLHSMASNQPSAVRGSQSKRLYLAPSAIRAQCSAYLIKNMLTFTEKQLEAGIDEIRVIADTYKLDEQTLLKDIGLDIAKEAITHKERRGEKKDLKALEEASLLGAGGLVAAGLSLAGYFLYVKPMQKYFTHFEKNHKTRGNYHLETGAWRNHYWFVPGNEGQNEEPMKQFLQVKNTSQWVFFPTAVAGLLAILGGIGAIVYLYKYLMIDPRHQERYDALTKIGKLLEKALVTPKNRITLPLEKKSLSSIIEQLEQDAKPYHLREAYKRNHNPVR